MRHQKKVHPEEQTFGSSALLEAAGWRLPKVVAFADTRRMPVVYATG